MSTGVSCTVLLNGERVADGSPGDNLAGPVALDNLRVTWGRSDAMQQPGADSCSFEIMDENGSGFDAGFRTGARVDVIARGIIAGTPSAPTFVNGGFETAALTWSASSGDAARAGTRVVSGAQALVLRPTSAPAASTLLLAPAAFQAAGTNPDAWDAIPTTDVGQTWTSELTLWIPSGGSVEIRPALFSGPYVASATIPAGAPLTATGASSWQTVRTEYVVTSEANRWVGLQLRYTAPGARWDDVAPTLTWDAVDPVLLWDDVGAMFIDNAQVFSPGTPSSSGVLVFAGRITELKSAWDSDAHAPVVSVTASGFTADLQNRLIGDSPWPVESVKTRAERIVAAAGLPITIDVDESLAATLLSWRDVDAQGALQLLQQVAVSVDGVLWPAVHSALGAYLRLEDTGERAALLELEKNASGKIVIVETQPEGSLDISSCDVLRDPVTWTQSVAEVVTRVNVTWKLQGTDDDGNPKTSDVTEHIIDAPLEWQHGTRAASVTTQLQASSDALDVGARVLARTSPEAWRAEGITLDDDDLDNTVTDSELLLNLLDGTSRIGAPLVLGDLPSWAPAGSTAGVYLEGGTYSFISGRWVLDLTVSSGDVGLGESAQWDQLDASWTWNDWDPTITWDQLRGVSA